MGRRFAFATCLVVASSGCFVGIDESLMDGGSGASSDGGGGGGSGDGPGAGDGGTTPGDDGGPGDVVDGTVGRDSAPVITDPTLLGEWTFEDESSSTAADTSGHGNDATLSGSPSFLAGHAGSALHLTASTAMSVAALGGSAFPPEGTLSFWIRVAGGGLKPTGPAYGVFDVQDDNRSHLTLRPTPAGGFMNLEVYESGTGQIDAVATVAPDDAWTHVIVTWSTSGQKLGLYSAPEGAGLQKHLDPIGTGFSTKGQFFRFGTAFEGDLDEVRLYSVVLDPTTLAALP